MNSTTTDYSSRSRVSKGRILSPMYWLSRYEELDGDSLLTKIFLSSTLIGLIFLCVVIIHHKL